jgi:hypothetical protein
MADHECGCCKNQQEPHRPRDQMMVSAALSRNRRYVTGCGPHCHHLSYWMPCTRKSDGFPISFNCHRFRPVCDQPAENRAEDTGMTPPELLLAALRACAGLCNRIPARAQANRREPRHPARGRCVPDPLRADASGGHPDRARYSNSGGSWLAFSTVTSDNAIRRDGTTPRKQFPVPPSGRRALGGSVPCSPSKDESRSKPALEAS